MKSFMFKTALLLLIWVTGCSYPRSQIMLRISATSQVLLAADVISIEARLDSVDGPLFRQIDVEVNDSSNYPLELPIVARNGAERRALYFRVVARASGAAIAETSDAARFTRGQLVDVTLYLSTSCVCPIGQRCENQDGTFMCTSIGCHPNCNDGGTGDSGEPQNPIFFEGILKAPAPDPDDLFTGGYPILSLKSLQTIAVSGDGNFVAAGFPLDDSNGDPADNSLTDAGSVVVFERVAGAYRQHSIVRRAVPTNGDIFGYAVALDASGDTLAVASVSVSRRRVEVFRRSGPANWTRVADLTSASPNTDDRFGYRLRLSADGQTLAISAVWDGTGQEGAGATPTGTSSESGAVYVYRASAQFQYSLESFIKASNTDSGDEFGSGLGLSADGSVLVVGSPDEDSGARGIGGNQDSENSSDSGAVYVYRRTSAWAFEQYIKPPPSGTWSAFGDAVDVSSDGDTIVVGAQTGEVATVSRRNGQWAHTNLLASGSSIDIGFEVDISGDGNYLLVSEPMPLSLVASEIEQRGVLGVRIADERDASQGVAALFRWTTDGWQIVSWMNSGARFVHDGALREYAFGNAIALDETGSTILISAPRDSSAGNGTSGNPELEGLRASGAINIFRRSGD